MIWKPLNFLLMRFLTKVLCLWIRFLAKTFKKTEKKDLKKGDKWWKNNFFTNFILFYFYKWSHLQNFFKISKQNDDGNHKCKWMSHFNLVSPLPSSKVLVLSLLTILYYFLILFYKRLAEEPGIARGKKIWREIFKQNKKFWRKK